MRISLLRQSHGVPKGIRTPVVAVAVHQLYKRSVMLMREDGGRFMTIRQNDEGVNEPDQIFRLDLMVSV